MRSTTRRTLDASMPRRQPPATRDARPRQLPTVPSHAVPTRECQSDPPSLPRAHRCSQPRGQPSHRDSPLDVLLHVRGLVWDRRALREGLRQAAWSTRSTGRLSCLGVERGGRDAPRAGRHWGCAYFASSLYGFLGRARRAAALATVGPCFRVAFTIRRRWAGVSLRHRSMAVRTSPTGPARRERRRNMGTDAFFPI